MKQLIVAALLLACPRGAWAQFSRGEDIRTKPPERWAPVTKLGLDLRGGGSYLSGNVRQTGYFGGLEYIQKFASRHQFMLEGAEDYSKFNDVKVMDKSRGSVLYAYSLAPRWNAYAASTQGQNRFTRIRYRTTNGAGLCYHSFVPFLNPVLVSAAVTPEYEAFFGGGQRHTTRATGRLNFGVPVSEHASLNTDFWYLPSLTDFHNYRLYTEIYLQLKVTEELLSFRVTWTDEYDSRPFPGIKPNDSSLNYTLVVHFGK